MAFSKARRLGDLVSATGEVSAFADASIVPADLHATLDLTGKTITVATASASDNDTTVASTAFVQQELASLVDSAPGTLNTLNELAAALGDDASFSTTVTNSIATKAPLAGPTFTSNINAGDGVELRLGNSQDILFKHHSGGYGHLENKTGTFYIDSETFDIRTDIDNAGLAIGIDANQRVGINQTPSGNNFTLQVTGKQTDGSDARAVYIKGYGSQTSIGGTAPTLVIQNANTTTNNYAKLSFESSSSGETVSINAKNIDHTNHYGDMVFNTRGSSGYSEKMQISSNGNVAIGVDLTSPQIFSIVEAANYDPPGLGNNGGNFAMLKADTGADYGLIMGIRSNGNVWQQVQRIDGSASAYHLELQPTTGNVSIGMGSNSTAIGQHKLIVNTDATNGAVGNTAFVHIGPMNDVTNNNADGYISGISLGYHENNNSYKHAAIAVRSHGDNAARRDMLFLVNTASEAASAQLTDAKITISSGTGQVTVGNTTGISDNYIFKVQTGNGYGQQGSHNSTYYHHETDRSYWYWNEAGYFLGGAHSYSDESLKKDVTLIPNALDSVAKMNGVSFNWKEPEKRGGKATGEGKQFGVIAQNMLEIDPELPTLSVDPLAEAGNEETDDKLYSMNYDRLSPFFIEAIKELKEKLEAAEARITELEG